MKSAARLVVVMVVFACALSSLVAADWPGFRGSRGGSSEDKDLPVKWTNDNFLWKVKLPGLGSSSPITSGGKIFVTCYTGYGTTLSKGMEGGFGKGGFGKGGFGKGGKGGFGKGGGGSDTGGDQKKLRLQLVCIDEKTGDIAWKKEIEPKLPEASFSNFLRDHGYATSTPVTDGERVYTFFGKTGVIAFDFEGKQLWQTSVGTSTNQWGSGASPVLYKNLVIVNASIESKALVALDKMTGKEAWRVKGISTSWSSPVIAETKDGKHELVVSLFGKIHGYDPLTGKELWTCQGIGGSSGGGGGGGGFGGFGGGGYTCSSPVTRDGIVYVIGGGGPNGLPTALAIRAGGRGDVTKTHTLWKAKAGTSVSSPVLCGDYLCWISGSAYSVKIDSGKIVYNERLYDTRNEYTSAIAAGDKIYAITRFNGLYVMAGGEKFETLAHNPFKGDNSIFNASPAISNGRLLVRSNDYLYCIGNK